MCKASSSKLSASFKGSESKLSDGQQRLEELKLTKDTADQLAIYIDESEKALAPSQERVEYLENQVAEPSTQLPAKEAKVRNKHERL